MKRDLKFRAWCGNDFVYFDLYQDNDVDYHEFCSVIDQLEAPIEAYTGFKDKNGVEIYEGDLLLLSDYHVEIDGVMECMKAEVKWDENYLAYSLGNIENGIMLLSKRNDYVVIGNIHQ